MRIKHPVLAILFGAALLLASYASSFSIQQDLTTTGSVDNEAGLVSGGPGETPAGEISDRSNLRLVETPPSGPEKVELITLEPMTRDVPAEIMEAIMSDLIERTSAKGEEVIVVRAEAVVWNDGALGCPQPGEMYIQVLINGYWMVLEVEGDQYDYRVSDKGSFKLCQQVFLETTTDNQPPGDSGIIEEPHPLLPILSGKTVKCKWPPCN